MGFVIGDRVEELFSFASWWNVRPLKHWRVFLPWQNIIAAAVVHGKARGSRVRVLLKGFSLRKGTSVLFVTMFYHWFAKLLILNSVNVCIYFLLHLFGLSM